MRQRKENKQSNWGRGCRSVTAILARRKAEKEEQIKTFPPDFVHGDVAVAEVYDVLGARWAERALFAVDDGEVTTVAYFDDYFLVIEQCDDQEPIGWEQWWQSRRAKRDRVVTLEVNERSRLIDEAAVEIGVGRERLRELEQGALGVMRDGMAAGQSREHRLCRGEIDVLSLVTLTSCLSDAHSARE